MTQPPSVPRLRGALPGAPAWCLLQAPAEQGPRHQRLCPQPHWATSGWDGEVAWGGPPLPAECGHPGPSGTVGRGSQPSTPTWWGAPGKAPSAGANSSPPRHIPASSGGWWSQLRGWGSLVPRKSIQDYSAPSLIPGEKDGPPRDVCVVEGRKGAMRTCRAARPI